MLKYIIPGDISMKIPYPIKNFTTIKLGELKNEQNSKNTFWYCDSNMFL